jgi:hypothetical protein
MSEKPPILSLEERDELKLGAESVLARAPEGNWMFIRGCLSLIAELEIKEAVIKQLGEHRLRDTRCSALAPMEGGMYRCILESRDGHTEHQYNWFRSLTKQEQEQYYPEDKGEG